MPRLELSFLGPFQVRLDGVPITGFEADKVRALLAYLAVESSRPHRREQLAALFWPGWPDASARTSLRNALSNLRKAIGDDTAEPPFLLITRETIQFNLESDYFLDTLELERLTKDSQASADQIQSALDRYRGAFLEGFTLKDCPAFDDWSLIIRERAQQQVSTLLSRLTEQYEQSKEYEKAIDWVRKRLTLEPWQEEAHQQMMRLLAASGQRPAALAQYEICKRSLKSELGVEPSAETVRLYESIRDSHEAEPAQSKAHPHNLPIQLTSFIGRRKEIAKIVQFFQRFRLVTLTGPGGTGKTRLSLQVAMELLEGFPDGVWLVELAPLVDPDLVTQTAANALGMHLSAGPQTFSFLVDYLQTKRLLMIFDNCEHLIAACARLVDGLVHACPNLSILVSSREALGIDGEMPFVVPPLTMPETLQQTDLDKLVQYEAIQLFVERASTVSSGFELTAANASAILQVCQRLDGIPLAIELAAARLKLLSVEEIAQRLDDRFRLLTGGSRAALPRYQTLRASIDWSYELLVPSERALLQRLSIFAGGWCLEAAEYVGCGDGIEACAVLDLLEQLVNKSLITVEVGEGTDTRYRLLETIRQYAQEKLMEAGRAEAARDKHLQYYLELAEKLEWEIRRPDQGRILGRLEAELDNLRLALAWSLEGKDKAGWDPEPGLRLAAALQWFWHCRGRQEEGIQWLELLLNGEKEERGEKPLTMERTKQRAKALQVAAWAAFNVVGDAEGALFCKESRDLFQVLGPEGSADYTYARYMQIDPRDPRSQETIVEEALGIFQEQGNQFMVGECLLSLGILAMGQMEYRIAQDYFEKDLVLKKELGDLDGVAGSLSFLGRLAIYLGNIEQARAFTEKSLVMFSEIQNILYVGYEHSTYWEIDLLEGNYAQADDQANEILSIGRRSGNLSLIDRGLLSLGELALIQGKYQEALDRFEENLAYFRKKDHREYIARSLYYLGLTAWVYGNFEQASQFCNEALDISREIFYTDIEELSLDELGKIAFARGDYDLAQAYFEEALRIPGSGLTLFIHRDPKMITLEALAYMLAAQGQLERAAHLLGATETWYQRFIKTRIPGEGEEREGHLAAVRAALGEEVFAIICEEGKAMTLKQAVAYAKSGFII
jgi:predicted ATPase/DNA-binding SARP family transcriptional activator